VLNFDQRRSYDVILILQDGGYSVANLLTISGLATSDISKGLKLLAYQISTRRLNALHCIALSHISPSLKKDLTQLICTKICVVVAIPDIIKCAMFGTESFRGYDFTGGQIFGFPIDSCMGLTTVQCYCAACDKNMQNNTRKIVKI